MKKQMIVWMGLFLFLVIAGSIIFDNCINKNTLLDDVTLKEDNNGTSSMFAIMVKNDDGEYVEYTDSDVWPDNMIFNADDSGCIDTNGNTVEASLSFSDGNVSVTVDGAVYCYLYFDYGLTAENMISSGKDSLWDSPLDGDGYRFVSDISTVSTSSTTSSTSGEYCDYGSFQSKTYAFGTKYGACPTIYITTYTTDSGTTGQATSPVSCPSVTGDITGIASSYCTTYSATLVNPSGTTTVTSTQYAADDVDNYICFGTTDIDTCLNNPSLYMYRIIGIFSDDEESWHYKLLKMETLESTYTWNFSSGIPDSYFLTNTTYSYMQDATWSDLIADWTYRVVDSGYVSNTTVTTGGTTTTKTYGGYGDFTASEIYYHETGQSSYVSLTYGSWSTYDGKIGLMYVSDYVLSLGDDSVDLLPSSDYEKLYSGWITLAYNDEDPASDLEWLLQANGYYGVGTPDGSYGNDLYFIISSLGQVVGQYSASAIRPVFYLESTVALDGDGSYESPYIILF